MKLNGHIVEKPWGRWKIPAAFGDLDGRKVGEIWYDLPGQRLPLLVKWLFTSEKLSIQVHPDDAQAAARGLPSGKEECWYVVAAEPDAVIGMGTKMPLSAEQLRAASLSGGIEALMDWKPVKAGDYFYIPTGTVHAIGAGITLVEVQQNADITYRLYDYGRLDNGKLRELHLDDGVAAARARPYMQTQSGQASGKSLLVESPHFRLWLVQDSAGLGEIPKDRQRWIVPLSGGVSIGDITGAVGDCLLAGPGDDVDFGPDSRLLVACE